MNHPKPEEWVPYVYGEAPANVRQKLAAHLNGCPQCREEIETWKRNLNRLDAWKMPGTARTRTPLAIPFVRWAAAAALMLAAGILIGRATASKIDAEQLHRTVAAELRRDLDQELAPLVRQEVSKATSLTLASSHRYSDQVGQQVYVLLKKDVDTVAVNAAVGLRRTAQRLVELADYKEPQIPAAPNE
jgi:anti-sigma factor RsiW